jgi:hypothetical protein
LLGVLAASRIRDTDAAASMAGAATGELVEAPAA